MNRKRILLPEAEEKVADKLYSALDTQEYTADLASGDIVLDLDSKEVSRAGKKVSLTAKEFLILEFLVRNKNRIVTRSEIVCNIWGDNFPAKERRIAAYMNSLRRKMENDISQQVIFTVTGKGYLLSE